MKFIVQCFSLLCCLMAAEYGELKHDQSLITIGFGGMALIACWLAYRAIQSNQD